MKIDNFIPSKSAVAHLRFVFSIFLLPVYLFAFSQADNTDTVKAILVFFIWHCLAYPASNGYNSYFDRDQYSIALLKTPPKVDISLYYFSILLELLAFGLAFFVNGYFAFAVLLYGIMSKMYSHPVTRLKKYPLISFLTVFFFQGAYIYWTTYHAIQGSHPFDVFNTKILIAGFICSCLIGASYPLTQVYQHQEDSSRGDQTLSLLLGYKGSFIFSAVLFSISIILIYLYWKGNDSMDNFYLFLLLTGPIFLFFVWWSYLVFGNPKNANYKNAMRMNFVSALCMTSYFGWLCLTA